MPRDGLDEDLKRKIGTGEAYDIAYATFTPQPALEDDALSDEQKSNYQAIGGVVLAISVLCAFATVAYGTEAGIPLAKALLMAFLLVAGVFSFGIAMATLRKWPFVVGLVALGLTLLGVAITIAIDWLARGSMSAIVFDESSTVTPEGAMVFGALFGGGCLYLAARLARSGGPFYGLR